MSNFKKLLKVIEEKASHSSAVLHFRAASRVARGTASNPSILQQLGRAMRTHYQGMNKKELEAVKKGEEARKNPTAAKPAPKKKEKKKPT
jgi:hypothetical protein